MKRSFAALSVFCFLLISQNRALPAEGKYGIGFVLGSPIGITGKAYLSKESAVDLGLGQIYNHGYYLWGDYLKHFYGIFPVPNCPLYIGVGLAFHDYEKDNSVRNKHYVYDEREQENRLEVRVPFGAEYMTKKIPLGIFLEIVPALRVIPDFDIDIRAGLGVRYYF